MKLSNINIIAIGCLMIGVSCKKFIEVDGPQTSITQSEVYSSNEKATAAVSYIYYDMVATDAFAQGYRGISMVGGLAADELKTYSSQLDYMQFNTNAMLSDNLSLYEMWSDAYTNIYRANSVMENIAKSPALSDQVKNQLNGEAKFMRAFFHFYLSGLFGKIPLAMSTDYNVNTRLARKPLAEVYSAIVADLKDAQSLLTDEYLSGTNTATTLRIRPNKAAATALLAKVYLYMQEWANAETQASALIENSTYVLEPDLLNVFKATSREAIWHLQPANTPMFTQDGAALLVTGNPASASFGFTNNSVLTQELYNAFELTDKRRANWVGTLTVTAGTFRFASKYKSNQTNNTTPEYLMTFRLAEQYLIRAEARAMQGKLTGANSAAQDINTIRNRAFDTPGLKTTTAVTLTEMMAAIEYERKAELFTEWGNRMMDIRRWKGFANPGINRADEVMPKVMPEKGGSWTAYKTLFPVPLADIRKNPNLDQNPGYGL
ncbi:Starch-binding associating with outer membrane [Pedobacter steynii]|uniref:Starch-binding associating with outer membrane n=1 Tax=Pedobacter steynii TaxID=430522 RepID=A0A1G9PE52_9SPHI|nr:RagB/SusD family nutrient uptake outer membrane protein [Pedobacter steynii]NQX39011.1 RagB/SusD family nutrient uptake outer membrane protein [Pedobacter steynii]SDL96984.1 Starch-binding associating with outer membrane [Pedobacter steynii]